MTEYWLHDPHARHLRPPLAGHRLVAGVYEALPVRDTLRGPSIRSDVLGLELCLDGERLRFFDPTAERFLRSYEESEARIAELEQALTARDGG